MDLGSLFSGFGAPPPPPNCPPATNYNTIIIIAIALAIILLFGNTPLNAGNLGFAGPMCPPSEFDGRHHGHYDRYGYSPYPNQGLFGLPRNPLLVVIAIIAFAFLLFPRRSPVPPAQTL